jgi:hypothetical protein
MRTHATSCIGETGLKIFNGFLIFLNGFPIFLNGFPIFLNGFPISSTALRFLQRLSAFFNGFPLSSTTFRFSSMAFLFPRNPRKSIYGSKYTKDHHSSFVFPATCSPSFVIATRSPSFVIATCSPSFVIATRSPSFRTAIMCASHPTHSCGALVFPTVRQI